MRYVQVLIVAALIAFGVAACSGSKPGATGALADDMSQGNPKAKVTVIEYASVGCPVCGEWQARVYPAFKAKYIDTGRVNYVFREMLVGGGSEIAVASAGFLLARCAGKDKYFAITDAVFASQPGIFQEPRGGLINIAKQAGMTEDQFGACVGDESALAALNKRVQSNASHGIDATPTFVVNGKMLRPGFTELAALDAAIAEAEAK